MCLLYVDDYFQKVVPAFPGGERKRCLQIRNVSLFWGLDRSQSCLFGWAVKSWASIVAERTPRHSWPLEIQQVYAALPVYLWTRWSSAATRKEVFQNRRRLARRGPWGGGCARPPHLTDWELGADAVSGCTSPCPHPSVRCGCSSVIQNLWVFPVQPRCGWGGPAERYSCHQACERCSQNVRHPKVNTQILHRDEQNGDSMFVKQQINPPMAWLTLQHAIGRSNPLCPSLGVSALGVRASSLPELRWRKCLPIFPPPSLSSSEEEAWLLWVVRLAGRQGQP